jgi:WD40 repeat protein
MKSFCFFAVLVLWCVTLSAQSPKVELSITSGHADRVTEVALSENEMLLATASWDGSIILWEISSGREIRRFQGHHGHVDSISFSADSELLASGSEDGSLILWNTKTGAIVERVDRAQEAYDTQAVRCVSFDRRSLNLVFVYFDGTAWLWPYPDQKAIKLKQDKLSSGLDVTCGFASDGVIWVASDSQQVFRWRAANQEPLPTFSSDVKGTTPYRTLSLDGQFLFEIGDFTLDDRMEQISLTRLRDRQTLWRKSFKTQYDDYAKFSPSGKYILVTNDYGKTRILDSSTGNTAFDLKRDGEEIHGAAFGLTESILVTGSWKNKATLWQVPSGKPLRMFEPQSSSTHLCGVPLEGFLCTNSGTPLLWRLDRHRPEIVAASVEELSPTGRVAFETESRTGPWLVALPDTPTLNSTLTDAFRSASQIRYSPDGSIVAVSTTDSLKILNSSDWKTQWEATPGAAITALDVSSDNKTIVTGNENGAFQLWTVDAKQPQLSARVWEPRGPPHGKPVISQARFSPDGHFLILTKDESNAGILIDLVKKLVVDRWNGSGYAETGWAFSSDSRYFARGEEGGIVLSSLTPKAEPIPLEEIGIQRWSPVSFSPDGKLLASGLIDGTLVIWSVPDFHVLARLSGHNGRIASLHFDPQSDHLFSGGEDGTVRVWQTSTREKFHLLATIATVQQSHWLVATPDGRFDTDIFGVTYPFHWVVSDAPFETVPVDSFVREYFTPGLLQRVLKGDSPKPLPTLGTLNRTGPKVTIAKVVPEADRVGTVAVHIRVVSQTSRSKTIEQSAASGVYDLRIFRNGQLISQEPNDTLPISGPSSTAVSSDDLDNWRKQHEVVNNGEKLVVVHHVRLPSSTTKTVVSFNAYAFNGDRVKGETSQSFRYEYTKVSARKRKAFIITMAVNANESGWDLISAVPSATLASQLLTQKLRSTYKVVNITLRSDLNRTGEVESAPTATKANMRAVFDVLAGRAERLAPALTSQLDPLGELETATPDDVVVLYIASHGYASPLGQFYVVPFDTGILRGVDENLLTRCEKGSGPSACAFANKFIEKLISSDDLSSYWKDVDAGQLVMVLDSCHSAAISGVRFRPGPLGDRGFGQLSYDKRMIILAASQTDGFARATALGGLGHTFLTEALRRADDASLSLQRWFTNTERELPRKILEQFPGERGLDVQLPELMNFASDDTKIE